MAALQVIRAYQNSLAMMDMDAKKTVELTMDEIVEIRSSLQASAAMLTKEMNQQGIENKLETIRRILEKIEQ